MPDPGEFNPNNRIAPGSDSSERPDFSAESAVFNKQLQAQEEQTKLLREISDQLLSNQKSVEETLNRANQSSEFIAKIQSEQNRFQTDNFARISETENRLAQSQELISRSVSSFTPTEEISSDSTSEFRKFIEAFKTSEFGDIQSEGQPKEQVEIFRNIESKLTEQNDTIEDDVRRRQELEDEANALPLWFREVDPEIAIINENLEEIKESTKGGFLRFIFNILKTIALVVVGLAAAGGGLYLLMKGNILESLKGSIGKALGGLFEFAKDKFREMFPNASKYIEGALVSLTEKLGEMFSIASQYVQDKIMALLPAGFVDSLKDTFTRIMDTVNGVVDSVKDTSIRIIDVINSVVDDVSATIEYFKQRGIRGLIDDAFDYVKDKAIESITGAFSQEGVIGSSIIAFGEGLANIGRKIRSILKFFAPPKLVVKAFEAIGGVFTKVFGLMESSGGILSKVAEVLSRVFGTVGRVFEFLSPIFNFLRPIFNTIKFVAGKVLLPLTIIITAIDAIVGAFKGFSRDGITGIIVGAVAGVISGITGIFGLEFDAVYDYLMSWINDFSGTLTKTMSAFWNFVLEYNPISLLFKAVDWLVTSIAEILGVDHILKKVKEFMGMIFDGLKDLAYGVLEWITGVDWSSDDPVSKALGTDSETLAEAQKTGEGETAWIAKKTAQNTVGMIFGMDDTSGPVSLPPDPEVTALLAKMKKNQETSIEMSEDQNTSMGQMTKELQKAQEDVSKSSSSATVINNRTTNNVGTPSASRSEPVIIAPQSSRNTEPTIRTMQFGEQPAF